MQISAVIIWLEDLTKPGLGDFVDALRDSNILVGLVSSKIWEETDKILEKYGYSGIFDEMSTIEEVSFDKPGPDLLILTADKLGVTNEECLVVEDTDSGIKAAGNAGMKVIAIQNGENEKELEDANMIVEGFSEITSQAIDQL